ncbi:hypothetical protein GW17_00026367 [Ensete ventricosum]|nr:hypothetical protein GW17_00026367 [Ensete ventricosum]
MELGLSRAEGSNEIAAAKGFTTSFTIEEAEERMVARVAGPQRATTDRGENRHQQQIVEKEKREQRRLRNRRSSYPYGEEEVMKLMQQRWRSQHKEENDEEEVKEAGEKR